MAATSPSSAAMPLLPPHDVCPIPSLCCSSRNSFVIIGRAVKNLFAIRGLGRVSPGPYATKARRNWHLSDMASGKYGEWRVYTPEAYVQHAPRRGASAGVIYTRRGWWTILKQGRGTTRRRMRRLRFRPSWLEVKSDRG